MQARNAASETSGIRDELPTHIALPTDIAQSHYHPTLPSILPYYRWYYRYYRRRYHPICKPSVPNYGCQGNLHYGLFTSLPLATQAVGLGWICSHIWTLITVTM